MRHLATALLAACLLAGCGLSQKLIYVEGVVAADEKGARVQVEGGTLFGSPTFVIENVKKYVSVPAGWTGPLPWDGSGPPPTPEPEGDSP